MLLVRGDTAREPLTTHATMTDRTRAQNDAVLHWCGSCNASGYEQSLEKPTLRNESKRSAANSDVRAQIRTCSPLAGNVQAQLRSSAYDLTGRWQSQVQSRRRGDRFNAMYRGGAMGHVQGSTLGFATPTILPQSGISWGLSPYAGQPFGIPQQYGQPFSSQPTAQHLPQILQFLQIVPQQLQQLQILQQQQLGQVQQLLQLVPSQLQYLQQLIQFGPQQIQSQQQQQPYGPGLGFGPATQAFTAPGASYVM
jgi:hypothetical protein